MTQFSNTSKENWTRYWPRGILFNFQNHFLLKKTKINYDSNPKCFKNQLAKVLTERGTSKFSTPYYY